LEQWSELSRFFTSGTSTKLTAGYNNLSTCCAKFLTYVLPHHVLLVSNSLSYFIIYLLTHILVLTYLLTYLLAYLLTYLLTPWFYSPLRALASFITEAHSSLSNAFSLHLLIFISLRSFSTSSSHLSVGLHLLLLPCGLLSNIFLSVLPSSIPTTCPTHSYLFFLIPSTMSRPLHSSLNS